MKLYSGQGKISRVNNCAMSEVLSSSYRISELAGLLFELGTSDQLDDIVRRTDVQERIEQFAHSELIAAATLVLKMVCEPYTKLYTLELLVEEEPNMVIPFLLDSLNSTDPVIRRWSCSLLARTKSTQLLDRLMDVLAADPSADVRVIAAYALGWIGDVRALSALNKAFKKDHEQDSEGVTVSDEAQEAIKKIRQK